MRCAECQWKYPEIILSPLFVGNVGYTRQVCGICALKLMNEIHGINRSSFTGSMAEANRRSAIAWRKNHPTDAPPVKKEN